MNLVRDTFTAAETLGKLAFGDAVADTIEQPEGGDQPGHSCIPTGSYRLVEHTSARLHEDDGKTPLRTWALVNEALGVTHSPDDPLPAGCQYPHRSECLLHPANYASQLEGCIAPGASRGHLLGTAGWMVTDSRATFKAIRTYLDAHPEDRVLEVTA